jgi:hypothetical protein
MRQWIYRPQDGLKSEMATTASSPLSSQDRRGVRKMLILFGVLGIIGVFLLAVQVVIGLVVLVAAQAFFLMAYRTFARRPS